MTFRNWTMKKTKLIQKLLLIIAFQFHIASMAMAQQTIQITFLQDPIDKNFAAMVTDEIEALLSSRYPVKISNIISHSNLQQIKSQIDGLMQDPQVDIVIALSISASALLGQLADHPKPSIAVAVIDRGMQGLPITTEETSGQHNFTYIETPFDVAKDLKTFKSIHDFKQLGVLLPPNSLNVYADFFSSFGHSLLRVDPEAKFTLIEGDPDNITEMLNSIPPEVDAIYLTPIFHEDDPGKERRFYDGLKARKLPSFSLFGEAGVRLGAMAAIAPDTQFLQVSRRIALNVMKIIEGTDAADLKVTIDTYDDNFVLNEETLREVGIYPRWEILDTARLIDEKKIPLEQRVNLRAIITEALENNLKLQLARQNTSIQMDEVNIARGTLLPQLTATTSITRLDENRANGEPGAPAPYSWLLSGQLSQLIYADDAWSNYAIQKILTQAARHQETAQMLDTIATTAEGYINLLKAKSNHHILENNLNVTRQNLSIARKKQVVGYTGATDVYRWESELAQNKILLNDAFRDILHAQTYLNQLLDRPLTDSFEIEEVSPNQSIPLLITDEEILGLINNYRDATIFADFLVGESSRFSPELHAATATVDVQKRILLNKRRAGYLPDIQLRAQIDKTLQEYDTHYDTPGYQDHPWSVSAIASFPIFDGRQRKHERAQAKRRLMQHQLEKKDLTNQVHLRVHTNLETAYVSYRKVKLSQDAYAAAEKNFTLLKVPTVKEQLP